MGLARLACIALPLLAAPATGSNQSPAERISACEVGCDSYPDPTDRATCRLLCAQAERSRQTPKIERWKETKYYGGSSPSEKPRSGTTTRVTRSPNQPRERTTAPRGNQTRAYLASCQASCNRIPLSPTDRATCKLQCFNSPQAQPRTWSSTQPPANAGKPCRESCAAERSRSDRATCQQICEQRARSAVRRQPTTPTKPPVTAPAASAPAPGCRSSCDDRLSGCEQACRVSGDAGSNRETCLLQCEQTASSCHRKCSKG